MFIININIVQMKTLLLSLIFTVFSTLAFSQNATNFTCNDCTGVEYDLFTQLDAGKVVVICWVMPCGACVGPSLTTYNVVQSYEATYPGKVVMYLCDDYANTNCTSLNGWANSQGLVNTIRFSNSDIRMEDYGSSGMPKIVVIAGTDHAVLYNANNSVNATLLQEAINSAITSTGIADPEVNPSSLRIMPNPSDKSSIISFSLDKPSEVKIGLYDQQGKMMEILFSGRLNQGENWIRLNTGSFKSGIYFIRMNEGEKNEMVKVLVEH